MTSAYEQQHFKIPSESPDYQACSAFVISAIESIIHTAIQNGDNKIIINTKHRVYSVRNAQTGLMDGIMEVTAYNAYDLKYLSAKDISYNPALGTGQLQIRDIHYVEQEQRTAWEFCQLLDRKYLHSNRRSFDSWLALARKFAWIKPND